MKWVLMPGMDGTGELFGPLIQAMPESVTAEVLSYPQDPSADYETLTEFVLAHLPKDEPFVLVAESFSGPLAVLAGAQKPKGLHAIILCATFIRNPMPLTAAWMTSMVKPVWFKWTPSTWMSRVLLGSKSTPELKRTLLNSLNNATPATLAGRARALLKLDATEALTQCVVPILYLQAKRDRVVFRRSLHEILAVRPDIKTIQIDAPHLLLQTCPEEACNAIKYFLSQDERV